MPSGCPIIHEKWSNYYTDYADERMLGSGDINAVRYLREQGFILTRQWEWTHPEKKTLKSLSEEEWCAMSYLVDEWDYGYLKTE